MRACSQGSAPSQEALEGGLETGFFEQATAAPTVQRWQGLAQVWTPYAIRRAAGGPVEYTGVNALQCIWDGKRWWITHLAFESAAAAPPPKR